MDKLKDKVFKSFEEATKFRPEIVFKNHLDYDRLRGSRIEFYFYVMFDQLKVRYISYYTGNLYYATEKDSPTGLDFQYDYYHGQNYYDFHIKETTTEVPIYVPKPGNSSLNELNGALFTWPDVPKNLTVMSHSEWRNTQSRGTDQGEFYINYPKSNSYYRDGRGEGYLSILYNYYIYHSQIYATEQLYLLDKEADGRYYYSHYGTHDLVMMLLSEGSELNKKVEEAVGEIVEPLAPQLDKYLIIAGVGAVLLIILLHSV